MKSRAHLSGHPLHPMLIPFPLAFFIGTFVFDVLFVITLNQAFHAVGYYLGIAGCIMALVAAVPGAIDYFATVPPKSSAKKRAAIHGLLNTLILILYFVAWLLKTGSDSPDWLILCLEAIGFVLLFFTGWMGATLVYRNQIGVNSRYAHAGRWKEEFIDDDHKQPYQVATSDELEVNQMKLVHVNNKRVVLARTEDGYRAFDDCCTHKGGSLAAGSMICGTVQCPWHGSQFDVTTGEVKAGPAKENIVTYKITESDGKVYLSL